MNNKYGERNFDFQNTKKALVDAEQCIRFNGTTRIRDCFKE